MIALILKAALTVKMTGIGALSLLYVHSWYEMACCSGKDCAPESPANIRMTYMGYWIKSSGEIIPFKSKKIRRSKDREYHRCVYQVGNPKSKTRCLYVPDGGDV